MKMGTSVLQVWTIGRLFRDTPTLTGFSRPDRRLSGPALARRLDLVSFVPSRLGVWLERATFKCWPFHIDLTRRFSPFIPHFLLHSEYFIPLLIHYDLSVFSRSLQGGLYPDFQVAFYLELRFANRSDLEEFVIFVCRREVPTWYFGVCVVGSGLVGLLPGRPVLIHASVSSVSFSPTLLFYGRLREEERWTIPFSCVLCTYNVSKWALIAFEGFFANAIIDFIIAYSIRFCLASALF